MAGSMQAKHVRYNDWTFVNVQRLDLCGGNGRKVTVQHSVQ